MNFLLFQPASLSEPDKVFYNGELIIDNTARGEIYDTIVSIFNKISTNSYPWFGKSGQFYVLRGLFEAKDETGRTLSFLFASDSENYQEELSTLSRIIGYKIDAQTLDSIVEFSTHKSNNETKNINSSFKLITLFAKKPSIIKYVSFAFVLIVLITIILIICNNYPTF